MLPDFVSISILLKRADHPNAYIRNGVTFGLGLQIGLNTPEIREALRGNVNDPDEEIRGEALVGLAWCGDPKTRRLSAVTFLEFVLPSSLPISQG